MTSKLSLSSFQVLLWAWDKHTIQSDLAPILTAHLSHAGLVRLGLGVSRILIGRGTVVADHLEFR